MNKLRDKFAERWIWQWTHDGVDFWLQAKIYDFRINSRGLKSKTKTSTWNQQVECSVQLEITHGHFFPLAENGLIEEIFTHTSLVWRVSGEKWLTTVNLQQLFLISRRNNWQTHILRHKSRAEHLYCEWENLPLALKWIFLPW